MSTAVPVNYLITQNMFDNAAAQGKIIRVNDTGKPVYRVITGAPQAWAKEDQADTIIIPSLLLSGSPYNVTMALQYLGFDNEAIQGLFNTAITKDNYQTTQKDAFDQLVANKMTFHVTKKPAESKFPLEDLIIYAALENRHAISGVTKAGAPYTISGKGDAATKGTSTRGARFTRLTDKIMSLASRPSDALDVSKLTLENKGSKFIKKPSPTGRSMKVMLSLGDGDAYNIVSDNADGLRHAVAILEHEDPASVGRYNAALAEAISRLTATLSAKTDLNAKRLAGARPVLPVGPGAPAIPRPGGSSSSSAAPRFPALPKQSSPPRGSTLAPAPSFRPVVPSVLSPRK